MASFNRCILIALMGSVMLTAVLAQSSADLPDVAGDAGAALKGAQDAASKAAQGAQDNAQKATTGIIGLGTRIYNTVKQTGNSILSHIPFVSGNKTVTENVPAAAVVEDKKQEEVPATTEAATEAQTDAETPAAEPQQQQEQSNEVAEEPKKEKAEEQQ